MSQSQITENSSASDVGLRESVNDPNNSSTTPLAANATFTGSATDISAFANIEVGVISDQSSATNGFSIQFSHDGVNWDFIDSTTYTAGVAGTGISSPLGKRAHMFRIVYTNGPVNQTYFRLTTMLLPATIGTRSKFLSELPTLQESAQLVYAVLAGQASNGLLPVQKFTRVLTDVYGSLQTVIAGQAADAFGRVRTTNPTALFDAQFQYDIQPLLFQKAVVGTGTVTKTANESSATLSTGGTGNNASAIYQTKQYFRYEPGKSQQILMTGLLGAKVTNVRSEIGYFDSNDGVFFRMDGWASSNSGMCVVLRTSVGGSVTETVVPQASWNFDVMDGSNSLSNPSGILLDPSKTQVFVIDFQWLGVGRVRYGFFTNGVLLIVHQVFNANNETSPYMNTANLPLHYGITNAATGIIAGTNTMKAICMTVLSEGGVDNPSAYEFNASNGATGITAASGARTPLIALQPKTTFNSLTNRGQINTVTLSIMNTGSNPVYWELIYNPTTYTGGSWGSVDDNSITNVNTTATTIALTAGTSIVLNSGYLSAASNQSKTPSVLTATKIKIPFTLDIGGTIPDTLALCITGIGGQAVSCYGQLSWNEVR